MEQEHRTRIQAAFRDLPNCPPIEVLGIPDDYEFMDEELIELLRPQVEHFIERA